MPRYCSNPLVAKENALVTLIRCHCFLLQAQPRQGETELCGYTSLFS